jgi:hypothetical protein
MKRAIWRGGQAILLLLVCCVPVQRRYYKSLRAWSASLLDEPWSFPSTFETHACFFFSDVCILALFLSCLVAFRKRLREFFFSQETGALLSLVFVSALSVACSPTRGYLLQYLRVGHLLTGALLFPLIVHLVKEGTRWLKRAFLCLLGAGLFESAVAIGQYFSQSSLGLKRLGEINLSSEPYKAGFAVLRGYLWLPESWLLPPRGRTTFMRAYGTLPHPNVLGGFLFFTILATYALYDRQEGSWRRRGVAAALCLQIFALFLTFSRAALFAWALASFFWFAALGLKDGWRARRGRLLAIVLCASAVTGTLLCEQIFDRGGIVNYNERAQGSDAGRCTLQQLSLEMIKEHPLLGVGYNNFLLQSQGAFPVHNIYLLVASETGLVGLALFLFFIGRILRAAWRKGLDAWHCSAVAAFLGLLFIGLCDCYLMSTQQGRLLFFLAAALLVLLRLENQYGGSQEASLAQVVQRLVRPFQGIGGHARLQRRLRSEGEERSAVLPSQVGDGAEHALLPQKGVGEGGDVAHVDACADDRAPFLHGC